MKILNKLGFSGLLKIAYVVLLVSGYFFVNRVLNEKTFRVTEKNEEEEKIVKVRFVRAKLIYKGPNETKSYERELKNVETVEELLSGLRDDNGFYYERYMYKHGTEIDDVMGIKAPQGYKWAVTKGGVDITDKILSTYLDDNEEFTVELIRI